MIDHPENPAATTLRQLYRRICLLRGTGQIAEAARLEETELPAVVAASQAAGADEAAIRSLYQAERTRVADLQDLAEILAPMLAKTLAGAIGLATKPAAAVVSSITARAAANKAVTKTTVVPSVADLIDSMLAQERA